MPAYYNEIDADAVAVLRQCIAEGVIAPGEVDTRSIKEVQADDLRGFTQCHFFAFWLMGFPDVWVSGALAAMQSRQSSRRKSSAPISMSKPTVFD